MQILRKRPMCWLAIGFLLIICVFLLGRSYRDVLYQENREQILLEGKIASKKYSESAYGGYWQIVLKRVRVSADEKQEENVFCKIGQEAGTKLLEGKYLCYIQSAEGADLKIGQQILLKGDYVSWELPTNPGQFDSGKYYCSQGILGQFKKCKILKQGTEYSAFQEGMWNVRKDIQQLLIQELGEDDGALISAMLLGEKSELDEEDKNLYQRNGISHILAISGLHLTLLGMGAFRILKIICGNNRQASAVSIIIMSLYCIFTGNSISTIRATIMFSLSLTAGMLGRSYDSLSALGLAAILQLFINPYVLNNSGFLLSFLAVIGVTFVTQRLQEILGVKGKVSKSLCISISASLTTLPVLLWNYGTYPWYSIFLNLLILPAMSVLMLFSILLVLFRIGIWEISLVSVARDIVVWGIKAILKYFEILCQIFEKAPFQDGYLGAPDVLQIVIYSCLVVLAISRVFRHSVFARKMILLSAISLLTLRTDFGTEVTMLDVGQGDSVVIHNSNGNVYISDCGSSSVSQVGKYRLIPFLKYHGYGKIKGVFVSHLDKDHLNGIIELMKTAPIEQVKIEYLFLPQSVLGIEEDKEIVRELKLLAEENKTRIVYLQQGDKISDGRMSFFCLYPGDVGLEEKKTGYTEKNRNNQSLVLLLQYKDFEMLLTGDIDKQSERQILEYIDQMSSELGIENLYEEAKPEKKRQEVAKSEENSVEMAVCKFLKQCDVLKVAHHGSSGSSCWEFLETVNPKLSLISYGRNNSYGHPHEETLERLQKSGSGIMTTPDCGAITIKIGRKIVVHGFKE